MCDAGLGKTVSSMHRLTRRVSVCVLNMSILRIPAGASGIVLKDPWRSPERCQLLSRLDRRARAHARTRLQLKRLSVGPRAGQSLSSPLLLLPVVLVCARVCAGEREAERESVCVRVCVCMSPGCEATRTMMTTANHEDDTDANT